MKALRRRNCLEDENELKADMRSRHEPNMRNGKNNDNNHNNQRPFSHCVLL